MTPVERLHTEVSARYSAPDTSDKRDDECWVEYWDRKRRERHGPDCLCVLCENEDLIKPDHGWCPHTYVNDPEIVGGSDATHRPNENDPEVIQ